MQVPKHSQQTYSVNLLKHLLLTICILFATSSMADNDATTVTNYTDNVDQWGAWGLDIEPAAGGLQPSKKRSLKAREAKVKLRSNSISALSPRRGSSASSNTSPYSGPANGLF